MQLLKCMVMGLFWTWILLISAAGQLTLSLAAPLRFTSYIPDGAAIFTRATKQSTLTHLSQNPTDQHHFTVKIMQGKEDRPLCLEDYKSIDPPPDSDTSKVKSFPIENGESSASSLDTTALIKP